MNGILADSINDIYTCTDLEQCRALFTKVVEQSKINSTNKRMMLHNIKTINSLIELQRYATNSFFAFNKMRTKRRED